jgi:cobalt-zinc-cadmium efflux system protein
MKTENKILIAFLLNLFFSIFEFIGGIITGSVAIASDAVHDLGDSISIGLSYILEKLSKKKPDEKFTYGYVRFSVLGSIITTVILLSGSAIVIYNAVLRIINPVNIDYNGMLIFACVGLVVNILASVFTHGGESLNQKAVSLHMLEDVLGWFVVLLGAVVMKFTDFKVLDPLLSVAVAMFILINALKGLKSALDIFLEKTPSGVNLTDLKAHLLEIDGVLDLHHLHVWSVDGFNNRATLHVVADGDFKEIKKAVKEEMQEHGIAHTTVECETPLEDCHEKECACDTSEHSHHHHHHH